MSIHTDETSTSAKRYMTQFAPRYSARQSNLLAINSFVEMFVLTKHDNLIGNEAA